MPLFRTVVSCLLSCPCFVPLSQAYLGSCPCYTASSAPRLFWTRFRSHQSKGANHQKKNEERLRRHLAKEGRVFDPHAKERARIENASKAIYDVNERNSVRGTMSITTHKQLVEDQNEPVDPDVLRHIFARLANKEPAEQVFVVGDRCIICNKTNTWEHERSKVHLLRGVEEACLSAVLAGNTGGGSARRFTSAIGMAEIATQSAVDRFWGEGLVNMPGEARRRMSNGIYFNSRQYIPPDCITGIRLGVVSYNGQGKYQGNKVQWYDELPTDVSILQELPNRDEMLAKLTPPKGEGWWPVIKLDVNERTRRALPMTATDILLVCFYQLLSTPLTCWAVSTTEGS